jgi:ribosomal protein L40E
LSEDIFELTRSPYYNEIINGIKLVCQDNFSSPSVTELLESIKFMTGFNRDIREIYGKRKLIQTEGMIKENSNIEKNFQIMDNILLNMSCQIKSRHKDTLLDEMKKGKEIISSLFKSFDEIERIDEACPKYSSNPMVNELLRVSEGVINGKFPLEPLQIMIEDFSKRVNAACEEFNLLKKSAEPYLEEEIKRTGMSYEGLIEAINKAKQFFYSKDKGQLKHAMELVKEHGEKLIESQKILEAEKKEPSTKTCLRCGTSNPKVAKICIKCRMTIPDFNSEGKSSQLDIKLQGDDVMPGQKSPMTENIYRLSRSIEDYKAGNITKESMAATFEWLEKKIVNGRKQFEGQKKKKPHQLPEKDRFIIEEMEKLTEKGISEFEEAIKDFRDFLKTEEEHILNKGLEKAIEAGEKLYKVQTMFQSHQRNS